MAVRHAVHNLSLPTCGGLFNSQFTNRTRAIDWNAPHQPARTLESMVEALTRTWCHSWHAFLPTIQQTTMARGTASHPPCVLHFLAVFGGSLSLSHAFRPCMACLPQSAVAAAQSSALDVGDLVFQLTGGAPPTAMSQGGSAQGRGTADSPRTARLTMLGMAPPSKSSTCATRLSLVSSYIHDGC
jgi:hypothetical protein